MPEYNVIVVSVLREERKHPDMDIPVDLDVVTIRFADKKTQTFVAIPDKYMVGQRLIVRTKRLKSGEFPPVKIVRL